MKKPIVKFMAGALAAVMVVTTPTTVFAGNGGFLSGIFGKSVENGDASATKTKSTGLDGAKPDIFIRPGEMGTSTISNTGSLVGDDFDNRETAKKEVVGISFDQEEVNLVKGAKASGKDTATLTAVVSMSDGSTLTSEDLKGVIHYRKVQTSKEGQDLTSAQVAYKYEAIAAGMKFLRRDQIEITAKHGGSFIVEAWLDIDRDGEKDFATQAVVNVKEYTESLAFYGNGNGLAKSDGKILDIYPKHTYDLNECIERKTEYANDSLTWSALAKDNRGKDVKATKYVTLKEDGKITIAKNGIPDGVTVTIRVVGEKGGSAKAEVVLQKTSTPNEVTKLVSVDTTKKVVGWGFYRANKTAAVVDLTNNSNGERNLEVVPTLKDPAKAKTDKITWTTNKPSVAMVTADNSNDCKATITPVNVGTAKITATATSGKKAVFSVTVKATLTSIEEVKAPKADKFEYATGQKIQMSATLNPEKTTDKITYEIVQINDADGTAIATSAKDIKQYATVDKKGVVTTKFDNKNKRTNSYQVVVAAKGKGIASLTSNLGNKVNEDITSKKNATLIVEPSKITATKLNVTARYNRFEKGKAAFVANKVAKASISASDKLYTQQKNEYILAGATDSGAMAEALSQDFSEYIAWATNKDTIAKVDDKGVTQATKKTGSANITAEVVNSAGKTLKAKVAVKVQQSVTSLQLNKTNITVNPVTGTKVGKSAAIKVSKQLPKGALKEQLSWKIETYTKDGQLVDDEAKQFAFVGRKNARDYKYDITDKKSSVTVQYTKDVEPGSYAVVTVTAEKGATATARVTLCDKTTKLEFRTNPSDASTKVTAFNTKNSTALAVGDVLSVGNKPIKLDDMITVISTTANAKKGIEEISTGIHSNQGTFESVTYTVNKKGIVAIDEDGYVYGLKKGTVKITATTPSNKKVSLTIEVKD